MSLLIVLLGIVLVAVAVTAQLFKNDLDVFGHWIASLGAAMLCVGISVN